jgi:superfamily II DNA or RNA helicase
MSNPQIQVKFDHGTLVVTHLPDEHASVFPWLVFDARNQTYRTAARHYRDLVLFLHERGIPYVDEAKAFQPLLLPLKSQLSPYPHQTDALDAWTQAGKRGIIELPTGAGKTILAVLAMAKTQRPTLIVVPTIDLLIQWQKVLQTFFDQEIGVVGGGSRERLPITVTTYDSATFNTEFWGDQFGLLICDECHHLPAPAYQFIADGTIAPFRLGLTATLERNDGKESVCERLLGRPCFSLPIDALEGKYLAPYEVRRVPVELSAGERKRYEESRKVYIDFLRKSHVSLNQPNGWAQFIMHCQRSAEGKAAFSAYREQRKISFCSSAKKDALWDVLVAHKNDRVIVFTEDNETVYQLSHQLFFPVITHQTKVSERKKLLKAFSEGSLPVLLTSKVLNEGVDVPEANIGIVLSGSGSVREHVQRLGRILRKRPGKRAILYEIFSDSSAESGVSERRRQHRAYMGRNEC